MPSLVNRVPPGLLSLLGIKALGVNPSVLPDELTSTIELLDLYAAANSTIGQFPTAVVGAVGLFAGTGGTVPAGKLWLVSNVTVVTTATLAAGTTYVDITPVWYEAGLPRVMTFGQVKAGGTAGQRIAVGSDTPVILPPNASVGLHCGGVTLGTSQAFYINLRYTELDF